LGAATAAKADELNFKVPFIQRFLGLQVLEFQCVGLQGSLNETLFGGEQTIQMYGDFEGFPL